MSDYAARLQQWFDSVPMLELQVRQLLHEYAQREQRRAYQQQYARRQRQHGLWFWRHA